MYHKIRIILFDDCQIFYPRSELTLTKIFIGQYVINNRLQKKHRNCTKWAEFFCGGSKLICDPTRKLPHLTNLRKYDL
jgi:hypothetical protein